MPRQKRPVGTKQINPITRIVITSLQSKGLSEINGAKKKNRIRPMNKLLAATSNPSPVEYPSGFFRKSRIPPLTQPRETTMSATDTAFSPRGGMVPSGSQS